MFQRVKVSFDVIKSPSQATQIEFPGLSVFLMGSLAIIVTGTCDQLSLALQNFNTGSKKTNVSTHSYLHWFLTPSSTSTSSLVPGSVMDMFWLYPKMK